MTPLTATTTAIASDHPPQEQLVLFMLAELPRPEKASVVRHLLTGCTHCLEVTRGLWELGETALLHLESQA